MTIREIIKYTTWQDVKKAIRFFYPTDKGDYKSVFDYLLSVNEEIQKYPKERLKIESVFQTWDFQDKPDMWYAIHTNMYSCSFRPWSELANIKIDSNTWKHWIPRDIIAHFIWEITYYGNEQQTKNIADSLQESVEEIKKDITSSTTK